MFSRRNSGTYNNQWMVVDYKRFKRGKAIRDDTLWVLEQLPGKKTTFPTRSITLFVYLNLNFSGYIVREDVSNVLRNQGYWPSYNTPYFKKIFRLSGAPENVKK